MAGFPSIENRTFDPRVIPGVSNKPLWVDHAREISMQIAGLDLDSSSTAKFVTLPITASGSPENLVQGESS